ncbi:hypothetical protein ETAA8_49820 [Anatilimnocola aggregata]|uniref:Uncharacterized protein n=1 Tax=Anatilimnocola aggregata TaxID=2528021 RepID=A0A517YI23_9BACT|nr:hypothetical protein [Anatilimnocola aggregata]QDU29866.1 hypothetical protein ETAA8_49820 [Anatilimnocola aggregata]
MNPVVLRGTKQEIAAKLIGMHGEVSEAIVFVGDSSFAPGTAAPLANEDMFAEMSSHMVKVDFVDDSRENIYTRQVGE